MRTSLPPTCSFLLTPLIGPEATTQRVSATCSDRRSARWDDFEGALNDTLATWMKLRLDAIRAADPEATVTVGHTDTILASLPANNLLDYRTLHRYPAASSAGVEAAIHLFRDVRRAVPGKALVLGEFGFSNADAPEDRSADLEAELVRGVRTAVAPVP